jgi:large subunit ribosomal protein L25
MQLEFNAQARWTGHRSEPPPASHRPGSGHRLRWHRRCRSRSTRSQRAVSSCLRKEAFYSSVLNAQSSTARRKCACCATASAPLPPLILHVDFQRVDATHRRCTRRCRCTSSMPTSPRASSSPAAWCQHVMNDIDVSCLPADLPAFIEVDLKDLKVAQSIHAKDLVLPKGVSLVLHGQDNPVVAAISAKKGGSDEAAAETPAA